MSVCALSCVVGGRVNGGACKGRCIGRTSCKRIVCAQFSLTQCPRVQPRVVDTIVSDHCLPHSVAKAFPPLLSQGHKRWMMPRYGAGDLVVNEENLARYKAGLKRRLSRGRAPAAVSNDSMQVAAE